MGYRIGKVTLHEFGPFEHIDVDLAFPGLTVVEGIIEGVRGCSSNGSGKSFIFDGVAWVLYDRCIRPKYTGDAIIKLGSRGETYGSVELVGGPDTVTIERYRKHSRYRNQMRLIVGGDDVSRGTDAQTLAALETMIGMDFTAFCNSVAFGVREDVKSFFSASDADRKKVLDTILGLELYGDAEKIARGKLRTIADELNTAETETESRRARIAEKESLLAGLLAEQPTEEDQLPLKCAELKVRRLNAGLAKIKQQVSALKTELEDAKESYDERRAVFSDFYRQAKESNHTLVQEKAKNERSVMTDEVLMRGCENSIRQFEKMAGGECLTCRQPVPKSHVGKVKKDIQRQLNEATKSRNLANTQLKRTQKLLEDFEWPEEPEDRRGDGIRAEIEEYRTERRRLDSLLGVATDHLGDLESVHRHDMARIETLRTDIEAAKAALESQEALHERLDSEAQTLEFWVEAFGNRGLKSFLIEAEVPSINRYATQYAQKLLGAGARVRLSATTQLKTKDAVREKLTVEGSIPGFTKTYAGASKGQKRRMDLSLLLAFRHVVAGRATKSFSQLFADEIFDGIDPAGAEVVSELLREIAEECPVLLVTHDPRIKPVADRVMLVRHVGGTATISVDRESTGVVKRQRKVKRKTIARSA